MVGEKRMQFKSSSSSDEHAYSIVQPSEPRWWEKRMQKRKDRSELETQTILVEKGPNTDQSNHYT